MATSPPQFDPNESRAGLIIGITTFVVTVAGIAVTTRAYTRACILRQFGLDDWLAIVAFVSSRPQTDHLIGS
jgi:hypothetical protein